MPSPFPGMDPYLEDREWEDFHVTFNTVMREFLSPELRPRYIVRVERRVYVEHVFDEGDQQRLPDLAVFWSGNAAPLSSKSTQAGGAIAPVECIIPSPEERRETFLVIREVPSLELVTVIETLSPSNKRASSVGRKQYLAKREEVLASGTNLVELDLLRGGLRLPVLKCPPGDFYAIVSRGYRRPRADVFAWTVQQPMPSIRIPLRRGDEEVELNLQRTFDTVYDRADYGATIDYKSALQIPLSPADQKWQENLIKRM